MLPVQCIPLFYPLISIDLVQLRVWMCFQWSWVMSRVFSYLLFFLVSFLFFVFCFCSLLLFQTIAKKNHFPVSSIEFSHFNIIIQLLNFSLVFSNIDGLPCFSFLGGGLFFFFFFSLGSTPSVFLGVHMFWLGFLCTGNYPTERFFAFYKFITSTTNYAMSLTKTLLYLSYTFIIPSRDHFVT